MDKQKAIELHIKDSFITRFNWELLCPRTVSFSGKYTLPDSTFSPLSKHDLYADELLKILQNNIEFFMESYEPNNHHNFFILYDRSVNNSVSALETYYNSVLYRYNMVGIARKYDEKLYFLFNPGYMDKCSDDRKKIINHYNTIEIYNIKYNNRYYQVLFLPLYYSLINKELTIRKKGSTDSLINKA